LFQWLLEEGYSFLLWAWFVKYILKRYNRPSSFTCDAPENANLPGLRIRESA